MELIIKIALLVSFFLAVFLRQSIPVPLYWGLFVFMLALVGAYYLISYWVSRRDAARVRGTALPPDGMSFFAVRKVSDNVSDDMYSRGRLEFFNEGVFFYVRLPKKQRTRDVPCSLVWSVQAAHVLSVAKTRTAVWKRGIILVLDDERTEVFTSFKAFRAIEKISGML
ncbi:hypothetical protein Spico_1465 [Parasphaerochaeta coccoides DSM 17374]|uniref:GRAM domain-containing protein n=1 Tax=Parasphaerochaeta coccoides (strain ATCC BAA-1237 / DSM 17374 / SPN1) TaxID=760011 RepID=F4GI70_PARC1|nr:hypothetical protein Spico_1465 [Parasphaerochaeta coccoides DSM 17374]